MRRPRLRCAVGALTLTVAVAWSAPVVADAPPQRDLVRAIAGARRNVRSLSGSFHQRRTLRLFRHAVEARGTFALRGSSHLLWSYAPPDDVRFAITPQHISIKEKGRPARSTSSRPELAAQLAHLRLALAGDLTTLAKSFVLSARRDAQSGFVVLEARARSEAIRPRVIEVTFDASLARPQSVTLSTGTHDVIEVHFEHVVVNRAISDEVFELR